MEKESQYWFKRRRYGWGWIPVAWQGWLVLAIWLAIVFLGIPAFLEAPEETADREAAIYFLVVILATSGLVRIGYAKGPKPKWRWGKRPDDNPKEDW